MRVSEPNGDAGSSIRSWYLHTQGKQRVLDVRPRRRETSSSRPPDSSAVESAGSGTLQNSEGARVSKKPRACVCEEDVSPLAVGQRSCYVTAALGDTLANTHAGLHMHALAHTRVPLTVHGGSSQRPALPHASPC